MSESTRHPLSFYELEGEIELGRGDVISTIDLANFPGSYPVYSSSAVGLGEFGRYGRYMFDEELITWSIDGGGRPFHRKKHRYSVTNVCGFLRIKRPDIWDYRYLHALLEKLQSGIQFDYQMKAHPSVIRELYQFERAPIAEQRKIGQILDTLDTAIRETEALIDKLKAVKQGLLHDLLTRGIDANGQLRPPQSEAPQLYKESPLGWIPKEWDLTQLGKFAALQRGHDIVEAKLAPGPFPVISSSGIVGYHNASTSSGPNVVVGRKGSIGTVHYVETDIWAHDTSLFVTNFFGNYEKFVFYLFKYLDLGQYGTKSGSPSLNRNDVHPLPIGRPSLDEQNGIVRILDSQNDEVSRSEQELDKLMKLKAGLMDDLLTGRIRVTPLLESARQPAAQTGA